VEWLKYFFGTPRRALATFLSLVALGLVHHCAPGAIGRLLAGAIAELWPVLYYVFLIAVVVTAIRTMFGRK
jgi:hypothetical protein